MDTHVTVVRRAVETEVDTKRYRAPCWVLCAAVETYLRRRLAMGDRPSLDGESYFVRGLCLQFRKDVLRLRLGSKRHLDGLVGMLLGWGIGGQVDGDILASRMPVWPFQRGSGAHVRRAVNNVSSRASASLLLLLHLPSLSLDLVHGEVHKPDGPSWGLPMGSAFKALPTT